MPPLNYKFFRNDNGNNRVEHLPSTAYAQQKECTGTELGTIVRKLVAPGVGTLFSIALGFEAGFFMATLGWFWSTHDDSAQDSKDHTPGTGKFFSEPPSTVQTMKLAAMPKPAAEQHSTEDKEIKSLVS